MIVVFNRRGDTMNDHADHLDQADEEILTYEVSDEALERSGGARYDSVWWTCENLWCTNGTGTAVG